MKLNERGQGMVEMMIYVPLMVMLVAGAVSVSYVCWQGLKTQQAANVAARMQGQERIGGGRSSDEISQANRGYGAADPDPSRGWRNGEGEGETLYRPVAQRAEGEQQRASVYGRYRSTVRSMFSEKERPNVYVPAPVMGSNTDQVKVVRVIEFPAIFGFQPDPIVLESTAYGGEDPHTHALPRWGKTETGEVFWKKDLRENPGTRH